MDSIENRIRQIIREELQPLVEALRGVGEILGDASQQSQTSTDDTSHRTTATRPSGRDNSSGSPDEHDARIQGDLMTSEAVRLYRIPEAASILAVSRDTVYRLIRARELSAVERRAGERTFTRIRADDLQAYIDGLPPVNIQS